ncbi:MULTISPECIES: glycosyltransferase [unclassified Coleofasciculus]|uniref:glycosyltransferase n=1 Tax=unclassified Coleofasciculus TaxID=2692782 RepID=UPI00187E2A39|nr:MULTISPECIES: glycosyltransferase [unclassified Coleofasciculus]MBE9129185.1 glycosyltransferase [Coleofasciculus sp. LEGE 07081]MBE9151836.1 glycosyltransferase [Coleofasciculus sp. LEGE 07092]
MVEAQPHIAIFLRTLSAGGAERVMLNVAFGIAQRGIMVDLVLAKAEGAYLSQVPADVRIVDLHSSKLDQHRLFKLPTSFQSTTSLPKLIRYLQTEKPTALLSGNHYPNEIAILAKYLARSQTRIVVSEHTTLSVEARRVEQVSSRLIPLTARLFYPGADGIVAVSQGVAKDLAHVAGLYLKKIKVIYNPVITPELRQKIEEPVEHPWFTSGEPPVIVGAGRFVEQKDFPTLLRGFAKVRQVQPVRLMMLGNGREQKRLEALAKELRIEADVAWVGFVKNPYAYMKRAAVFVLSSAWEGLPTVLIEALAVGIPVVSTNCPSGPNEILDNGKYGWLVPVGDSEAIADAILKVLSGNFKSVEPAWLQQFSLEAAIQNYLDTLLSLSKV